MKKIVIFALLLFTSTAFAQHTPIPHGTVYGTKPEGAGMVFADKLESSMCTRATIVTSVKGKVLKVTKKKGGWFTFEPTNGKIIYAYLKLLPVTIPSQLGGHTIIADGVASKQFTADDDQ